MIFLSGGSYKSITELGKENYKQKLQIQQRFGTKEKKNLGSSLRLTFDIF
jgi:hypothetical protein